MGNNMTMGTMFPSTYLKAEQVKNDPLAYHGLIISDIKMEQLEDKKKVMREKPVLYFSGITQGLVLNKTNRSRLMEKFQMTEETPVLRLIGKEVNLIVERVESFGDMVDAIRIAV